MMPCQYDVNFYHPSVCNTCKNTGNLKTCSSCYSVSYCSKEHQIVDWPFHKKLCKVICDTNKVVTVEIEKQISDNDKYNMIRYAWSKKLKRDLSEHEMQILQFRRNCAICYTKNCAIGCQHCSSVFYCSLEHQKIHAEKHKLFCAQLKLHFDLILFNNKNQCQLKLGKSIPDDLIDLPKNLINFVEILKKKFCFVSAGKEEFLASFKTVDTFGPTANIIFGLEKAKLIQNRLLTQTSLVVHIVGGDEEEQCWNYYFMFELIFHWIKNLNKVTFIFIGPYIQFEKCKQTFMPCGSCNMNKTNAIYVLKQNYYHDIVDDLEKPDLVIAFNCGIYALPTWIKSIPSLLKYPKVPLVITEYCWHGLKKNLNIIQSNSRKELEIIIYPQKNPFGDVSPQVCFVYDDPLILYNNAYITILFSK